MPEYREWDDWLSTVYPTLGTFLDDSLSRYSEYKNYTHNIRLTLRHWQEEYDYNIGILMQPQRSNFIQDYRGHYVDTIRNVVNFTPTIDFHYKFSDQQNIYAHYRGDTQQPEITQLLEIRDDSNPLYITSGNRGLKPQFTNSLNVYYNNYIQKYKRSIVLYGNYRHIRNAISNKVTYHPETGGSESRPENINGNWNADGGFNFSTAIDSAAHWNIGSDTRLRYNNYVSYVAQAQNEAAKNTTKTTNWNQRLNASFRNDWLEVTLDGNVNYQHSRNELIWNGQISKTFLKSKTLVVALNFYDLLGQQSNYDRWVNANGRSDTRYNSINSYAMLHVRYRLNMFGGKVDTEGRYDKKWGNNDRRER